MFDFLEVLFNRGNKSALGIDIGSSSIKVVQLKRDGNRAVLETYGELSLGPYAGVSVGQSTNLKQEKLIEALSDLLKEKEVNITTNTCGTSIPFSSSLMSVIEMPNVSPKELESMVPLEARKYIPVPISEVALDWSIIPKNVAILEGNQDDINNNNPATVKSKDNSTLDILLVAIHNDTLNKFNDIMVKNNLDNSFFEIEIFSIMRSVLEDSIDPVLILDLGAGSTKFFIVERGLLRQSHTLNRGSQNITSTISKSFGVDMDKAEVMKRQIGLSGKDDDGIEIKKIITITLDYIFEEANKVIVDYEKKYGKNISKVILVGGGSALNGIEEVATKNLKAEAFQGDPFSKVVTPAFIQEILKQTGPQFAVAVGLALRKLEEMK